MLAVSSETIQDSSCPESEWSEVAQSCPTLCDPVDTRLLHPWDFLGKSTGVGCHFLLQGIFPTQGSNLGLLHCRQTLYRLSHQRTHSQFSIVPIFFISSLCLIALATLPGKTIHLVLHMFHESFLSCLPDILPCSSHLQCFLTYTYNLESTELWSSHSNTFFLGWVISHLWLFTSTWGLLFHKLKCDFAF